MRELSEKRTWTKTTGIALEICRLQEKIRMRQMRIQGQIFQSTIGVSRGRKPQQRRVA
jgi:hypothetical protein